MDLSNAKMVSYSAMKSVSLADAENIFTDLSNSVIFTVSDTNTITATKDFLADKALKAGKIAGFDFLDVKH